MKLFNKNKDDGWIDVPETLTDILKKSYNLYTHTNGYFDPSVGKLVDIWGFGKSKNIKIPTNEEIEKVKKQEISKKTSKLCNCANCTKKIRPFK